MKRISLWAKNNPIKTRLFIALCTVVAAINALILAALLYIEEINVPPFVLYIFCGIYLLAILFYPLKKLRNNIFIDNYFHQKVCDFSIFFAGAMMVTFFALNFVSNEPTMSNSALPARTVESSVPFFVKTVHTEPTKKDLRKKFRKFKKEVRTYLKGLKQKYKAEGNKKGEKGVKILLILLTVVGSVAMGFLVFAAACSLSCAGQNGAAVLVGIGGLGLVVFLSIIAFRGILDRDKPYG